MAGTDDPDRRAAWAAGQRMRALRARLVSEVASGALTIDGLLARDPTSAGRETIKVVVLAEKVPGVGKVRARRAMAELGIPEDARWGEIDAAALRALWSLMAEAATRPI
jgi:hypothetical protein